MTQVRGVHVPEEWERADRSRESTAAILRVVALHPGARHASRDRVAVVSVARREVALRPTVVAAAALLLSGAVAGWNSWPTLSPSSRPRSPGRSRSGWRSPSPGAGAGGAGTGGRLVRRPRHLARRRAVRPRAAGAVGGPRARWPGGGGGQPGPAARVAARAAERRFHRRRHPSTGPRACPRAAHRAASGGRLGLFLVLALERLTLASLVAGRGGLAVAATPSACPPSSAVAGSTAGVASFWRAPWRPAP